MEPPRFIDRMQNFTVGEGQPVTLTCMASGVPTPNMSWQKDGKMITELDYRLVQIKDLSHILIVRRDGGIFVEICQPFVYWLCLTKGITGKKEACEMWFLRHNGKISWKIKNKKNEDFLKKLKTEKPFLNTIKAKKLNIFGHDSIMENFLEGKVGDRRP